MIIPHRQNGLFGRVGVVWYVLIGLGVAGVGLFVFYVWKMKKYVDQIPH